MKRKWLFVSIGAVILVAFFITLGVREQSDELSKLQELRAKATQEGIPLTVEEFTKFAGPGPESENAWTELRAAIVLLRPGALGGAEQPNSLGVEASVVEELMGAIRAWRRGQFDLSLESPHRETIAKLGPVFQKVRDGVKKPFLYIQKDWKNITAAPIPEASELSRIGRLMVIDGIFKVKAGNLESGFSQFESAAALARLLASAPLFVFARSGASLGSDVVEGLKTLFSSGNIPKEHFSRAEAIAARLDLDSFLKPALKGYVFYNLMSLEILSSRERMVEAGFEDRALSRSLPKKEIRLQAEIEVLTHALAILSRWSDGDTLKMREALGKGDSEIDKAMSVYFPTIWSRVDERNPNQGTFGRILQFNETLAARRRMLKGYIEAFRKHVTTGQYPPVLPLAGPDAIDPFSGKPFQYRTSADGFVIYSYGINRIDDQGVDVLTDGFSLDIVYRYPAAFKL